MSDYLHGIEIKEGEKKVVIQAGNTSVIALVGTAPKGAVNEVKLITSLSAGKAEYGDDIAGFTIPGALEVIFGSMNAKVLVVNVLAREKAGVLLEEDGRMTRDESGKVVTHLYKPVLPEAVDYTAAAVGGIALLENCGDTLGVKPNVIIAPGYSQLAPVAARMVAVAEKLNGFAVVDVVADSVQAALTARNTGVYNITSPAAVLCFPVVMRYNSHEGINAEIGLSAFWAGAKALRDAEKGYHISPSNTELLGIAGLTVEVTSSLTDTAADSNLLNGAGIVTVFRKPGAGTRLWGNWTAAYPAAKTPDGMIAPRAVRMAIREALVDATLNYVDKTPTKIAIDMVTEDVNAFLRGLAGKDAIVEGECRFAPEKNPAAEVAQGKLTFVLAVEYQSSLERLTFEETVEY
ncbi:MAG: phage tail sheath subtilisin-like domain-containing protein [Culturomica sp.]|jgi:phage tail sheath protein FI|nr:phage tail sheath subtilisin-like domain-containing protein [Culturomica sp.]